MRRIRLLLPALTGAAVVTLYAVVPFAACLRPLLTGLAGPAAAGLVIVALCATKIIAVLRRTAPLAHGASGLLQMPVLSPDERPAPVLAPVPAPSPAPSQVPDLAPVRGRHRREVLRRTGPSLPAVLLPRQLATLGEDD